MYPDQDPLFLKKTQGLDLQIYFSIQIYPHNDGGNDVKKNKQVNILSKESGFGFLLLLGGIRETAPTVDTLFACFCRRCKRAEKEYR